MQTRRYETEERPPPASYLRYRSGREATARNYNLLKQRVKDCHMLISCDILRSASVFYCFLWA